GLREVPRLRGGIDGAPRRRPPGARPRPLRAPAAPSARAGRLLPLSRPHPEEQGLRGPELRGRAELPGMPQAPQREPGLPDMPSIPPARGSVSAEAAPPAPRPPAQVVCRARSGVTLSFPLKADESLIGRDSGLAVAIPLEGVSRQHARIRWNGRSFWLEDLKSTNGTLLNGQRIVSDRLRHLDVITLGKTAEVIFVMSSVERGVVRQKGIVRAALVADSPDAIPHEIVVGEVTLGRSPACNIVAEGGAVSKVHARIERTVDQL